MSLLELRCESLSACDATSVLAPAAVPDAVKGGAVVQCRRLLQAIGWAERLDHIVLDALRQSAGDAAAASVAREGIERLHEHVNAKQIVSTATRLRHAIEPNSRDLLARSLDQFGVRERFWFDPRPKVRLQVPYALAQEEQELLVGYAKKHGDGKVTPHDPHLDSWHRCPRNSFNLWFSIGRSRRDNGMTVFPELFARRVPHEHHAVTTTQYFGRGIDTELERGDAWLFAGDHLHTSIVNHGPETRAGISFRFTFDRPRVADLDHEHFVSSRWYGTPLAAPTTKANATLCRARYRVERTVQAQLTALRPTRKQDAPVPSALEPLAPGREQDDAWNLASSHIGVGEVRALHAKAIVWRGASGRAYAALRMCPHRGADMALGEVRGEQVLCPWHRLALGEHPPAEPGVPRLRMLHCTERDGRIVITRR